MISVLVVDDSAFMRNAIRKMLADTPGISVVGIGHNGREAVELNKKLRPDVITLDIEMPELDGMTALQQIMASRPTAVLMLSSLTTEGSHAALRCLSLGAADFLAKDGSQISLTINSIRDQLVEKVKALAASAKFRKPTAPVSAPLVALPPVRPNQFDLVCIGSSTGGPAVLEQILPALPSSMQAACIVAQHMPAVFTASLTERLTGRCPVRVVHVTGRTSIEPRTIYIAQGGMHTHVRRSVLGRLEAYVSDQPKEALYRPSVDVLLSTAAAATKSRTLGIVLTGIGNDGTAGAKDIHEAGGMVIAQDQQSSVVYGMPKSVTEKGFAAANLSPDRICDLFGKLAAPTARLGAA